MGSSPAEACCVPKQQQQQHPQRTYMEVETVLLEVSRLEAVDDPEATPFKSKEAALELLESLLTQHQHQYVSTVVPEPDSSQYPTRHTLALRRLAVRESAHREG
jgi:hypothetical protein